MKSSPTAEKQRPVAQPQCAGTDQQRRTCWFRPEYTVTDPDQQRSVAGEASLTVNTQRLDNQQNGTLYSAADLTLDIPDIRNSGLITGDNGLMLNAASLSNPEKSSLTR